MAACRDIDVITNAYATTVEAEQAGAMRNGEIPIVLPKGAHDILEAHDLDGSRRWGVFSFAPADADTLRTDLAPYSFSFPLHCDPPVRIEWWPILLRGDLDAEKAKSASLEVYTSRSRVSVAVNWNQGRAYYFPLEVTRLYK